MLLLVLLLLLLLPQPAQVCLFPILTTQLLKVIQTKYLTPIRKDYRRRKKQYSIRIFLVFACYFFLFCCCGPLVCAVVALLEYLWVAVFELLDS